MDAFLPAIRNSSSHHYLGLTERLELLTNTVFTVAKLLYAFVWQVSLCCSLDKKLFQMLIVRNGRLSQSLNCEHTKEYYILSRRM